MTEMNRRGFVKTLFLSAAGVAVVRGVPAETLGPELAESDTDAYNLENGEQKLRVASAGSLLSFQNYVRADGDWKASTLPNVPLVTGPSFPLKIQRVSPSATKLLCEGNAAARGLDGKRVEYPWKSEIESQKRGENDWFRFRTTLSLPASIRLQQGSRVEPQIILWLNKNSTLMEGQSGSWRRVHLQQPTRNSLGAPGNDLPALYMLDNNEGVETMMYFDVGDMDWMSFDNLPRFLVCRCSMTSHLEPGGENQRFGVGLIADQAAGDVLPAGDVRFTYWLMQRRVPRLLNEQQAVSRWIGALLPLFEETLDWPPCASTWQEFAAATVKDLQDKATAQVEVDGHLGLRAYVKGSSQLWTQPANDFELMTVADVLWPSLLYLRIVTGSPWLLSRSHQEHQ